MNNITKLIDRENKLIEAFENFIKGYFNRCLFLCKNISKLFIFYKDYKK